MANGDAFKPTLLVGVGGTGCAIAEQVFQRAIRAGELNRGRLGVIGFDTDSNDMRRLTALDQRRQVRFSTNDTIQQLVSKNAEIQQTWFGPVSSLTQEIRNMTLLDGAAQIRLLTRLGLHHGIRFGDVRRRIEEAVADLSLLNSRDRFEGAVNVMFVGSLAGATGSGSFLQLALLFAHLCKGRVNAEYSALFLLPDAFVRGAALPSGQIENVLANGYAALKELNAVNHFATGRSEMPDFAFEVAPGIGIEPGTIPFRSVAFIDYENTRGGSLGRSLDAYKRMTADAAYLLVFTPIGQRTASIGVNDARARLSAANAGTHNLYAGIGVSAVDYPVAEMIGHLTNRLALELLGGDWLRLDRLYYERVRRYEEQRRAGNLAAVLTDQGDAYLQDLAQLASQDRIPFFAEIYGELFPRKRDEQGFEVVQPLHEVYLTALLTQVRDRFWDRDRMAIVRQRRAIDATQLKNLASLSFNVRSMENDLDDDLGQIDRLLAVAPEDDFKNLLLTADDLGDDEWREHHLQSHIIRGGPHLVRVRAFLFALKRLVGERKAALKVDEYRLRLMRLANVFDDARGKEPTTRGTMKVHEAARQTGSAGLVTRVLGGAQRFQDQYASYYNASLAAMRKYADEAVDAHVLDLLETEIAALERHFSGLFSELGAVFEKLNQRITVEEARHGEGAGLVDGRVHIYADVRAKQKLWSDLSEKIAGLKFGVDANRALARDFYGRFREARRLRQPVDFVSLGEAFRARIVDDFARAIVTRDFASIYDFSVVEAIRRQARLDGERFDALLRRLVDLVASQSEPFVSLTDPNDGQRVMFWAINPSVRAELNDDELYNSLFTFQQGEAPLALEEFSDKEFLCMNSRVNLELSHLGKLNPGTPTPDRNVPAAGRYSTAYRKMIDELLDSELAGRVSRHFTPHVDHHWHRPGLLPEISPDFDRRMKEGVHRAFVVAHALDLIERVTEYGLQVSDLVTVGKVKTNGVSRRLAESWDVWAVLQAFERRAELARLVDAAWAETRQRMATDRNVAAALCERLSVGDLAGQLIGIAITRNDPVLREERTRSLLTAWARLVRRVLDFAEPARAPTERDRLWEQITASVSERLDRRLAAEGVSAETLRHLSLIFDKAIEIAGTPDGEF
jgi:hypothetical protein